ncbi:MAG: hydrogenase maturation nickel metallochaperone HypA [Acidobacteria bacterium]|nr:hydrogenase maturation nickel metallochaperone HypA [Acidobacteriota bacterium]
MKKWFQKFRNIFNRDKEITIYCQHCGKLVVAEYFKCPECGKWRRNIFTVIVASLFFAYGTVVWVLFLWKVLPAIFGLYHQAGVKASAWFSNSLRFSNFFYQTGFIIFPLIAFLAAYFVFIWKPHKNWGINLFLIVSFLFNIVIHLILFVACVQLLVLFPR